MAHDELRDTGQKLPWKRYLPIAFAVLTVATLLGGWQLHRCGGNALPLPWPDEAAFFWPAVHWAQDGSLMAPELNPDRHLMWMPPGMMVALGTLFKVLPIRLAVARWASWAMLATGYVCCMLWFRRLKGGFLCAVLLSGFFLNGTFTAVGNVARMDAWLWAMVAAGFLLLHSVRPGWPRRLGWTLLAISPLMHPNGVYFLAAAGIAAAGCKLATRWKRPKAGKDIEGTDQLAAGRVWPWVLMVAAIWIAYLAYAAVHGEAWLADMAMQFSRKGSRSPWLNLLSWPVNGCLAWYLAFGVYSLLRNPRHLWLVAWGGASLLAFVLGKEMWYRIFEQVGWLWMFVLGFQVALPWRGTACRIANTLTHAALFVWAGIYFMQQGYIESPKVYGHPQDYWWNPYGMFLERDIPYVGNGDEARMKEKLDALAAEAGRPVRVAFQPTGDQLLFLDSFSPAAQPFCPLFTDEIPDYTIIHHSRFIGPKRWWQERSVPDDAVPFLQRDETEMWYCLPTVVDSN